MRSRLKPVVNRPGRRAWSGLAPLARAVFRGVVRVVERLAEFLRKSPDRPASALLGSRGEDLAYWFLRRQGYTIVARNYRRPPLRGEIDLIAWEGGMLVFIEVKTRIGDGAYSPERAVDREKRHHLIQVARGYRRRRRLEQPYRYDVVAIRHAGEAEAEIALHRNAFREDDD